MEALRLPTSPQLGATAYGRTPYVDETASIEAQAELLPQMYAQKAQEDYFAEQTRLANEEQRRMNRDSNIALGIKGTELGYQVASRYGKSVLDALKPKPVPIQGDFGSTPGLISSPSMAAKPVQMASAGSGVSDVGGNWFDTIGASRAGADSKTIPSLVSSRPATYQDVVQKISEQDPGVFFGKPDASPFVSNFGTDAGTTAAPVMGTSGFSGILPKFGGTGVGSSAGNFAVGMIPGIAGSAAGALVERSNFGEFLHKRGVMGEKEGDLLGGAASGFLTGFALGGIPGGIAGGIGGLLKGLF